MRTAFFLVAPIAAGVAIFATDLVILFGNGSLTKRIAIVAGLCASAVILLGVTRSFGA